MSLVKEGFLEIFTTIAEGLKAFNNIADGLKLIGTEIKRANDNAWFQQSSATFKPLEQGKTTDAQKDEAAKAIGDLIHHI